MAPPPPPPPQPPVGAIVIYLNLATGYVDFALAGEWGRGKESAQSVIVALKHTLGELEKIATQFEREEAAAAAVAKFQAEQEAAKVAREKAEEEALAASVKLDVGAAQGARKLEESAR